MSKNVLSKKTDETDGLLSIAAEEYMILQKQIERLERTVNMDMMDRRALFVKRHQLRTLEAALNSIQQ